MTISNLKPFIALAILPLSQACQSQHSNNTLINLNAINNDWYSLSVELVFSNKQFAYPLITSSADQTAPTEQTNNLNLAKLPFNQLKQILPAIKPNPFRQAFPDIYQNIITNQYDDHEFTGFKFELDDNVATSEWLLAFQFAPCSNEEAGEALAITCGNEQIHAWVIQQNETGNYHVIMESDGSLFFSKNQQVAGYKSIKTQAFNEHNYLSEPKGISQLNHSPCGKGEIQWRYEGKKYQPIQLTAIKGSCDLRFLGDNETIEEFADRTERGIRYYLSVWLKKFTDKPPKTLPSPK